MFDNTIKMRLLVSNRNSRKFVNFSKNLGKFLCLNKIGKPLPSQSNYVETGCLLNLHPLRQINQV